MRFFLSAGLILLVPCAALSAPDRAPVEVRAEQVEYFDGMRKVVATGGVEATYRDTKLICDRATIYMETKDAYLEGNVRLAQVGGLLKGEEMIYNFETRKGTVLEAEGEVGLWRTRGNRAEKISSESFLHRSGYLTSCDFEDPHTRVKAKEVRVYMDDKVVLKDAVFYLGYLPVFYVPSYIYPLDDKRPRVTLLPGMSKEWGFFLLSSWKIYWNENLRGHFHADFREQKDLATGFDLNYKLPEGGEGIFREYYTNERQLNMRHIWTGRLHPDKSHPTTERVRFRFQLRHIWELDESNKAILEFNQMKDPTIIKDFFLREFEEGAASSATYFQFLRTAPWYGLSFLMTKQINPFERVTQQLPSVTLDLRPIGLSWLPNFADWVNRLEGKRAADLSGDRLPSWFYQSSYKYEHSNVGDTKNGEEASLVSFDSTHEIFHPMRLLRRMNFRPFFRFRQTTFSRGLIETDPQFRQAAALGFDLNSKVFRVFSPETNFLGLNIHRLRHVITPSLNYLYQAQPTLNADKLIRSDGLAKSHLLTPSVEHKLQTKRSEALGAQTVDLARFITTMPYDLEGPGGRGGIWKTLAMDFEAVPYNWMRLESDAQIDPHIGKFTTINADFILQPGLEKGWSGRSIGEITDATTGEAQELAWVGAIGWRYLRNTSAQMTFETQFNLGKKWRAGIYEAFDVKRFVTETGTEGDRIVKKIYDFPEFEYRLRRDLHEWTVEAIYNVRRGHGQTALLVFHLKAAPDQPFDLSRSYHKPKAGRNFRKPGEPIRTTPAAPLQ